jgi:hypothetical protein
VHAVALGFDQLCRARTIFLIRVHQNTQCPKEAGAMEWVGRLWSSRVDEKTIKSGSGAL